MKQPNLITEDFFEGIPRSVPVGEDVENLQEKYADLAGLMSESLFVLDFQRKNFLYVSPHYLFLCGYSQERVKELGYEFFREALHPDDLPLWKNIHVTILKSLYRNELPVERIDYFGCTLRIRNFLSDEGKKPDYLMTYLKIKPKLQHDIPQWGICLLSVAVVPKSGNLCSYYDNHDCSTYSFESRKWTFHPFEPLSKREKRILVLTQEGLTNEEMAKDKLHLSIKTVEKAKTSLFEEQSPVEEQNLNSFLKKLQYANNRGLIYQSPAIESNKVRKRQITPPPLTY